MVVTALINIKVELEERNMNLADYSYLVKN